MKKMTALITDPRRLITSGDEELTTPEKPHSAQEKLETLIRLIIEKHEPQLEGRIKVELDFNIRLRFRVCRNGKAIIIRTGVLPNDKRFNSTRIALTGAALQILKKKPFYVPAKMTMTEREGWDGLLRLGARLEANGAFLNIRPIASKSGYALSKFLHLWDKVTQPGGANTKLRDENGNPKGVYTRERL